MSVLSMDTYQCCLSCNSKVETVSGGIGRCKRCSAAVKRAGCAEGSSARFVIHSVCGWKYTVVAFNEIVRAIIERSELCDDICPDTEKLLFSPQMVFHVNKDVVRSVEAPSRDADADRDDETPDRDDVVSDCGDAGRVLVVSDSSP